jgi:uncharacterized membrane protein YeaQ/YmgE (transglycosylase-associated protein family)
VGLLSGHILGLMVGFAASQLIGSDRHGMIGNHVGTLGALLGGWIATELLMIDRPRVGLTSIVVSVVGAIVLIFLYRILISVDRQMRFRY